MYSQQSYKVSDSFPFKWINKKWKEGFFVTSMATAGSRWAIVMSRNAGFRDQVMLCYLYSNKPFVMSSIGLFWSKNWILLIGCGSIRW